MPQSIGFLISQVEQRDGLLNLLEERTVLVDQLNVVGRIMDDELRLHRRSGKTQRECQKRAGKRET